MGRIGSTTSVRARQMRPVLARWQHSGLTLREFGEKRGIPPSTLSWWRQVFRRAGDEEGKGVAAENPVAFTEVPPPAKVPRTRSVLEIVLHSGHLVRVPAGVDPYGRKTQTAENVVASVPELWIRVILVNDLLLARRTIRRLSGHEPREWIRSGLES